MNDGTKRPFYASLTYWAEEWHMVSYADTKPVQQHTSVAFGDFDDAVDVLREHAERNNALTSDPNGIGDDAVRWRSRGRGRNGDPFMSAVETHDGYVYARRAGYDSFAFILYSHERGVGLLYGPHVPTGRMAARAFTGSFDVPAGIPFVDVVIEEVREETGYSVTADRVHFVSKHEVGSQTDESVWLYRVNVAGLKPESLKLDERESQEDRHTVWNAKTDDWRAILLDL